MGPWVHMHIHADAQQQSWLIILLPPSSYLSNPFTFFVPMAFFTSPVLYVLSELSEWYALSWQIIRYSQLNLRYSYLTLFPLLDYVRFSQINLKELTDASSYQPFLFVCIPLACCLVYPLYIFYNFLSSLSHNLQTFPIFYKLFYSFTPFFHLSSSIHPITCTTAYPPLLLVEWLISSPETS